MGLFDRFRRRVTDLSETVDLDALTAEEDSEEGRAALRVQALSTQAEGPDQADEGTVNKCTIHGRWMGRPRCSGRTEDQERTS